jgi:hypothetical protein
MVNRLFKHHHKQLYSEGLLTRDHALISAGRIMNPSVNISFSVDHNIVAPEMTVKRYKECCISNAMEGTNMLWNDSEDRKVRSEYEEDEGTDCEDGDSDTDLYR